MTLTVSEASWAVPVDAVFWAPCVSCGALFPTCPGEIRCRDCADSSASGDELAAALVQVAGSHAGGAAGAVAAYRALAAHYDRAADRWANEGCAELAGYFRRAADALAGWSR